MCKTWCDIFNFIWITTYVYNLFLTLSFVLFSEYLIGSRLGCRFLTLNPCRTLLEYAFWVHQFREIGYFKIPSRIIDVFIL